MKQSYCNISVTQYRIMCALDRGLTYRRELEFELKTGVKAVDRSVQPLIDYGFVIAVPCNDSAAPHNGKRIVRFELSELGREMYGILIRIKPHGDS